MLWTLYQRYFPNPVTRPRWQIRPCERVLSIPTCSNEERRRNRLSVNNKLKGCLPHCWAPKLGSESHKGSPIPPPYPRYKFNKLLARARVLSSADTSWLGHDRPHPLRYESASVLRFMDYQSELLSGFVQLDADEWTKFPSWALTKSLSLFVLPFYGGHSEADILICLRHPTLGYLLIHFFPSIRAKNFIK